MTCLKLVSKVARQTPGLQLAFLGQLHPSLKAYPQLQTPSYSTKTTKTTTTTTAGMSSTQSKPRQDWSANQYLKFAAERTRPVHDLAAQLPLSSPARIVDVGCGPGNSTAVLASRFPDAVISGVDSSPDMISKARAAMPDVEFSLGDLRELELRRDVDLVFSNAVFQWLRQSERIPSILKIFESLKPGGVLAFQMPDNYEEPSARAMRETASSRGPWRTYFQKQPHAERPELDPIEPVSAYYEALAPQSAQINIWHTFYQHIVPGPSQIVEWVKGTGLQPFLGVLPEEDTREAFLQAYEARIGEVYPRMVDGKLLLRYPRLFVVAVKR